MKYLKIWAAASLLIAGCAVSFTLGRGYESQYGQAFEDACKMSDLIRCYEDHLNEDTLIQDWGCFDELEGVFLEEGTPVVLKNYSYCY